MIDNFDIATGSITGYNHIKAFKNNQDALNVEKYNDHIIGIVSDGCGSSHMSEVGSHFTAKVFMEDLKHFLHVKPIHEYDYYKAIINNAFDRFVYDLKGLHNLLNHSNLNVSHEIIEQYLLATLVGFIIGPQITVIFHIGDGVCALNDGIVSLDTYDNAPPYPAYNLNLSSRPHSIICRPVIPTSLIDSLMIGTDGCLDFEKIKDKNIPGKKEEVGPLNQFWQNGSYINNPVLLQRRLNLINTKKNNNVHGQSRIEGGYLHDDTTMIIVKRIA